jgi:hypothetical protein
MTAKKDLLGQTFGELKVIAEDESTRHGVRWRCLCNHCGLETVVYANALTSGRQVSCGCVGHKNRLKKTTKHGHNTRSVRRSEYSIWSSMKDRCTNKNNPQYKDYGGRGIYVCPEWLDSYETFFEDMGPRPKDLTIERIDNDGPYAPWNCRWATHKEQQNNMRTNHNLTFNGKTLSIAEWAREIGVSSNTLYTRILTKGWSIEKALTTPLRGSR